MEDDSQIPDEPYQFNSLAITESSGHPAACALCCRDLPLDNPMTNDLCGDCKFLCWENLDNTPQRRISRRRRRSSRRSSRYSSSDSTEDIFSQQFSQMISLTRQNHATSYEHEEQYIDGETSVRSWQQNSSRSTPSGSRRWRRMLSDTESDGFDNVDSLYGESESNFSFSRHPIFHGESDGVSISSYGGDSEASVDEQNFLGTDVLAQQNGESDVDSDTDTDIDPMHAGVSQWDLDNNGEDEVERDDVEGEWEDTDGEETEDESHERGGDLGNSRSSVHIERNELILLPGFEGVVRLRFRGGSTRDYPRTITSNWDESYDGNSGDYLDERGFEELLERLAENDNSRRGAPPASLSCINSLPLVIIKEELLKQDSIMCAICKDSLTVGSEANQLPCFHLYHPSCILPWLSSRNSCPLCRYELPTDDQDYEESKQDNIRRMPYVEETGIPRTVEDSSYNEVEATEERESSPSDIGQTEVRATDSSVNRRGRWLYLAATPILGLVGMALVLWFGNPLIQRRQAANHLNIFETGQTQADGLMASFAMRENRSRRWWPFF